MPIMTPNMNLLEPVIGQDTGLTWEQSINANTSVLDGHNHSAGSGVQINPSGININGDLTFNSNNAITLRSVRFFPQLSPLSGASDLGCLYESGVDLWYNDGSGNQIKITSGGAVNATSSGIVSGTNSASFVSNVLVVNANTNTPADIQGASIFLGNNVVNSKYLELSPPNAMAANYQLVLPSLPSVQSFMTLDAAGNMSAPWTVDGSTIVISANHVEVPAGGITSTQLADGAVEIPNLGTPNYTLVNASVTSGAPVSTTPVAITSTQASLTSTVSGRLVQITYYGSLDWRANNAPGPGFELNGMRFFVMKSTDGGSTYSQIGPAFTLIAANVITAGGVQTYATIPNITVIDPNVTAQTVIYAVGVALIPGITAPTDYDLVLQGVVEQR